jgi:hypothetical protein
MKYDFKYLQDIQQIKLQTDDSERFKLVKALAKSKDVKPSTIYRHLKDGVPGHNGKSRSDKGTEKIPITKKQLEIAAELKKSGAKLPEIQKEIEERTGSEISMRTLNKITQMIKHVEDDKISEFGDPFDDFIKKHFNLDKIPADQNLPITLGPFTWQMPKEDVLVQVMLLKNSFNKAQLNSETHFPLDSEAVRETLLLQIHMSMLLKLRDSGDVKDLKELNIINKGFRMQLDLTEDLKAIERYCQELKPGVTLIEIAAGIRRHHSGAK